MAESENESDSSGDYVDASDNPIWYSDEMYGITRDMIQRNMELFTDRLQDTKYGMLDKLIANGGLTYQETIEIDSCSPNPCDKTRKLIDVVLAKNVLTQFIKALVDTDQKHLVNYLRGNGVFNAKFGDDWPLGEDRIRQLDMNREYLINKIDTRDSGLIYILLSAKVISERQYSFVSHGKDRCKVNSVLLDVIRRQSLKQYNNTIVCLNESKQWHIGEILTKTGVIQRIRVSQEGDPQTVNEAEDAISDRLADSLRNLSIEEAQRVLEMTQLKIIAAKKGESIYLYVYIETLQELIELRNLLVTGAMKVIVETLFNKLVSRQDLIVASCTHFEEEFAKCKSYFKVADDVFCVNLERHRVLLEERMDPDHGLVDRLLETEAIDYNQFQIICSLKVPIDKSRKIIDIILETNAWEKIEKFSQALRETKQQHLLNYVEANGVYKMQFAGNWPLSEKETFKIDINREYLTEKIDTGGGLLANMRKHKIITQSQQERVSQRPSGYHRNRALLEIIRRGSLSEYKNTIGRLMETKQEHIAKILTEAGAPAHIHPKATVRADQPVADQGETEMLKITCILQEMTPEEKISLVGRVKLKMLGLHDVPVGESAALSHPSSSAESLRKQGTSKNRREMTEGCEQEMPSIGPGTAQSPDGISTAPGMAEGGEQEMPRIGCETAQPAPRISSAPVEINEHTLNNAAIPKIRKVLVDRMNPDFGIMDKLLILRALSRPEIAEVANLSSPHEKNLRLLQLVTKNDKLSEFFNALKDTHQDHLVNYVTAKGEYSQDYGGSWPLTERETRILYVNHKALTALLDFTGDEIIHKLYRANVLNRRQNEFISKQSFDYMKAEVLLDFLYRSSMNDYWKMITFLTETNQKVAAKILLDGGAPAAVHKTVTGKTEAATRAENEIVTRIESILSNMNLQESNTLLERLQLKLFAARTGH